MILKKNTRKKSADDKKRKNEWHSGRGSETSITMIIRTWISKKHYKCLSIYDEHSSHVKKNHAFV